MLGSRGIWHDGWKAVTTHPTISGWSHFDDDTWELYHTEADRSELHDLAAEHPDKLRELVNLWFAEAGANGAFPLDDRSAAGDHPHAATTADARPEPLHRTTRTLPRCPRPKRSTSATAPSRIGALVDIPAAGAQGVLFAQGARFGGHALYIKDNRLHYVNNFVGMVEQKIDGDRGRADRREPHLVGLVRKGRRRSAWRGHGHPVALPRRQEGRRRPDQDPARDVRARWRGAMRRPRQRRAGHRATTRARTRTPSRAARSTE